MLFDQVNVIYSRPLKGFGALLPEHAEMISKVSPKIKLRDVSRLVEAENHGDAAGKQTVGRHSGRDRCDVWISSSG